MSRFRCLGRSVSSIAYAVCSVIIVASGSARGETLEEIEGLSVTANYQQSLEVRPASGGVWSTTVVPRLLRVYISTQGRIFEYAEMISKGYKVSSLDKATEGRIGLNAWTMIDGHLTYVVQQAEGLMTYQIAIDTLRLTCTVRADQQSDPKTGRFVTLDIDKKPWEVTQRRTISSTCVVQRGNIFAPQ